jgi:hypothetical protein
MRDREPDGLALDNEWAERNWVRLRDVYDRCYIIDPAKSYELQCRNQRQALRRALGRMFKDRLVTALALAWVNVEDHEVLDWYGGGRRERSSSDYAMRYGETTPNWKMIVLTDTGIKMARLIEQEPA